ncbi:MAG: hypothetical protein K0S51_2274 [Bacillales bacterium]|jgi:uncharacterized protein (TIGR02646 family)|nr:hypothetical protein [Bacillales bacterium]
MLLITKGSEPKSWTVSRLSGATRFDDLDKSDLRTSLLQEQGYICCYCMKRIRNNYKSTKIEHLLPQSFCKSSKQEHLIFSYNNLFAACDGDEKIQSRKKPKDYQHCDTFKGDKVVTLCMTKKSHIDSITYNKDGKISSSIVDINVDINENLNLNLQRLKDYRADIYDQVRKQLGSNKSNWTAKQIRELIDKWESKNADGQHKQFYGVAVYFLQKRLNKALVGV